jgi:hypothetical protein
VLYAWNRVEQNLALQAAGVEAFRELSELLRRNWRR